MSRVTIILLTVGVVSLSAAALWIVFSRDVPLVIANPTPGVDDADRRHRAENFFGGAPDRDVRDGQEMKPRW